ncbi:dimethylsulfonioproprionate lyase family protein [Seohaeicola zhoushanensis]|uniref:Cupin domain-containing protein n=1 Tax=Seohaeicola zhoushanensis TaxID=1569283 RepID=A0A8J3M3J3_9RHOB|nr:dimethylsulfonioproprionate lyase family protein [Seohaeicola zhoushanensis]GHF34849.1 hypothetical protein GCM10017056_02900 [Seohaeicola zhoushanensis]
MQQAFDAALAALYQTFATAAALREFALLPDKPRFVPLQVQANPVAQLMGACALLPGPESAALFAAARMLAPFGNWRSSYTEEQVGRHFLDNFAYVELVGPEGHFESPEMSAYLLYMGPNMHYRRHWHEAEELYYIIAGEAEFQVDGEAPALLGAGDSRLHMSNQPHQTWTRDSAVVCLVLWRGEGVGEGVEMEAAPNA